MNYRLAYAIGFHPCEDLAEHPPYAGKLLELVAREADHRCGAAFKEAGSAPLTLRSVAGYCTGDVAGERRDRAARHRRH